MVAKKGKGSDSKANSSDLKADLNLKKALSADIKSDKKQIEINKKKPVKKGKK